MDEQQENSFDNTDKTRTHTHTHTEIWQSHSQFHSINFYLCIFLRTHIISMCDMSYFWLLIIKICVVITNWIGQHAIIYWFTQYYVIRIRNLILMSVLLWIFGFVDIELTPSTDKQKHLSHKILMIRMERILPANSKITLHVALLFPPDFDNKLTSERLNHKDITAQSTYNLHNFGQTVFHRAFKKLIRYICSVNRHSSL